MTTDDNKVQQVAPETQAWPADNEPVEPEVAAKFLKVSKRTLFRYVESKRLPCHRIDTTTVRFFLGEVRAWLKDKPQLTN